MTQRSDRLVRGVTAKLPAELALRAKLGHDCYAELHRLSEALERDGLRETARRLDIDPSNPRRKLAKLAFRLHEAFGEDRETLMPFEQVE